RCGPVCRRRPESTRRSGDPTPYLISSARRPPALPPFLARAGADTDPWSGAAGEGLVRLEGRGTRDSDGTSLRAGVDQTLRNFLLEAMDPNAGLPRGCIGVTGIALLDRLEEVLHELEQGRGCHFERGLRGRVP